MFDSRFDCVLRFLISSSNFALSVWLLWSSFAGPTVSLENSILVSQRWALFISSLASN